MNLNLINGLEEYWGEVVDTTDPLQAGRVKIKIVTVFDEIETEFIPWATPKYVSSDTFEKPYLGEIVQVTFNHGDIMMPQWFRIRKADASIPAEDYESLTILKDKNLANYGVDGHLNIQYSQSEGLSMSLARDGNTSEVVIRNDNSILITNGSTQNKIHLSNSGISIGSEETSQQPAVVGDDNMKALQMLNDTILDMATLMSDHLNKLSIAAGTSPYTKHLQVVFGNYEKELVNKIQSYHDENDSFFPETKSTFITLDKTEKDYYGS